MQKYKENRRLIKVNCDHCGNSYEKPETEYLRNVRLNRKSFCSRECTGLHFVEKTILSKDSKEKSRLSTIERNKLKSFNPFKFYLKCAKSRFKECNLTLEDLKEQWDIQNGICIYSGISLILNSHINKKKDIIHLASLDRIDSSLGYIKGNIQYVSQSINYMKHTMSHEETLLVCKLITKNYLTKGFPLD
jgi:hypothetical protein